MRRFGFRRTVWALALLGMLCTPGWAAFDGIWKDVPSGSPSPSINYFIQTYQCGSAVVLATEDLGDFYAFLDPDISDGFDADDLSGAGRHLTVVFFDQDTGNATLSQNGQILKQGSVFKWFPIPSASGEAGFWKDAQTGEPVSMNFYYQTYETGSSVAVVTGDLSWFYAFLDPDISDGFDVSDLAGRGARLRLTFSGTDRGTARITLPVTGSEGAQEKTIYRWNEAPGPSVTPATGGIQGRLGVSQDAFADADTNDPFQQGDNDSQATAQEISIPASVGGWSYAAGLFNFDQDYYRIQLNGNPVTITLVIAEPDKVDLDLYLLDAQGQNILPPSRGTGKVEQIVTTTETGEAYVWIPAYPLLTLLTGGSSNYTLIVGQNPEQNKGHPIPPDAAFVPGQAVVRFRPGIQSFRALEGAGFRILAGNPATRPVLVQTDRRIAESDTALDALAREDARERTVEAIYTLRARPDVLWAEPNYIRRPTAAPNDPMYAQQWHYPLINLLSAWNISTGDPRVIVAILDTGILSHHPDFDPSRFVAGLGYDFIRDPRSAADGDGLDPDPEDPGDKGAGGGASSFHGTHVAGTVGAWTDNGVGVAGVDRHCTLMILRVLGTQGGTDYDINQAILYAAGLPNDSGTVPTQRADVINMSLGGPGTSSLLQEAVDKARAAGVVVVAAAGNESSDASHFVPGALDGVVTVSAVDLNKQIAWYSNRGSVVEVAAPGGDTSADVDGDGFPDGVLSTLGDDSGGGISYVYGRYQGTSMAAPHVAGVVALMQAAYMNSHNGQRFTPAELDAWLAAGLLTVDLGPPGKDDGYGFGLIDAKMALEQASGGGGATAPVAAVSPTSLNFDTTKTTLFLTVLNVGGNDPSGTFGFTVSVNPTTWLSVDKTQGTVGTSDPNEAVIAVSVDRTGLSEQVYTGTVTITAQSPASGTLEVPVIMMTQSIPTGGRDVGPVYVLAVDPVSLKTIAQKLVFAKDLYVYEMTSLAAGTYLVAAGTDRNNNGFIDDEGEAFGFFPLSSLPQTVVVGNNQTTQADFPISELFDLSTAARTSKTVGGRSQATRAFKRLHLNAPAPELR